MKQRGWDELDVVLITGDAYIDSPFMGIAVVGRLLEDIGLRVGIIGQPDINSDIDIKEWENLNFLGSKWWKHRLYGFKLYCFKKI